MIGHTSREKRKWVHKTSIFCIIFGKPKADLKSKSSLEEQIKEIWVSVICVTSEWKDGFTASAWPIGGFPCAVSAAEVWRGACLVALVRVLWRDWNRRTQTQTVKRGWPRRIGSHRPRRPTTGHWQAGQGSQRHSSVYINKPYNNSQSITKDMRNWVEVAAEQVPRYTGPRPRSLDVQGQEKTVSQLQRRAGMFTFALFVPFGPQLIGGCLLT
jgi:hypothetical protein